MTWSSLLHVVTMLLAFALGTLMALFGVLLTIFSDDPRGQRPVWIAIVLLIYLILGVVFGAATLSWQIGLWLSGPGAVLLVLLSVPGFIDGYIVEAMLVLVYAAGTLVLPCLGAMFGRWARLRLAPGPH